MNVTLSVIFMLLFRHVCVHVRFYVYVLVQVHVRVRVHVCVYVHAT
jgi:hypothetical protein